VGLLTNLGGMPPVIVHDQLHDVLRPLFCDPVIQTELVTAHAEFGTATLRSELLRYEMILKKKDQPLALMVLIIEQPTTERREEDEPDAPTVRSREPTRE